MKCNFKAPVCHFYKGYFACQSSLLLSEKLPPKNQKSYTDAVGTTAEYILNETYCCSTHFLQVCPRPVAAKQAHIINTPLLTVGVRYLC